MPQYYKLIPCMKLRCNNQIHPLCDVIEKLNTSQLCPGGIKGSINCEVCKLYYIWGNGYNNIIWMLIAVYVLNEIWSSSRWHTVYMPTVRAWHTS